MRIANNQAIGKKGNMMFCFLTTSYKEKMNNNEFIIRMIIINILLVNLIYVFPIFWEKLGG